MSRATCSLTRVNCTVSLSVQYALMGHEKNILLVMGTIVGAVTMVNASV